jgi:hypothetical protein
MQGNRINIYVPDLELERIERAIPEGASRSAFFVDSAIERIRRMEEIPEERIAQWELLQNYFQSAIDRVRELERIIEEMRRQVEVLEEEQ